MEKHASQKDYAKGFGGKFGVQEDRKDKSAVGWEYKENLAKHESQMGLKNNKQSFFKSLCKLQILVVDHSVGFGGKFGVQKDRQDKSAVGWEHKEHVAPHESQKGREKTFYFHVFVYFLFSFLLFLFLFILIFSSFF